MAIIVITQYLRPTGRPAMVQAFIPDELVELASTLDISCELLSTGEVAIYASEKGKDAEDERTEIATNGPGENSPDAALVRLIRRFEKKEAKQ